MHTEQAVVHVVSGRCLWNSWNNGITRHREIVMLTPEITSKIRKMTESSIFLRKVLDIEPIKVFICIITEVTYKLNKEIYSGCFDFPNHYYFPRTYNILQIENSFFGRILPPQVRFRWDHTGCPFENTGCYCVRDHSFFWTVRFYAYQWHNILFQGGFLSSWFRECLEEFQR